MSWLDSSCISLGANRYDDFATGIAQGIRSMRNSTSRDGGNPDRSSGNTLGKSQTTGMSSSFSSSVFMLFRCCSKSDLDSRTRNIASFVICNFARAILGDMAHLITLPEHWTISGMLVVALGALWMRPGILPNALALALGGYNKVHPGSLSLVLISSTS
ncbi:hypothetical protein Tco_0336527, partial [Tanacetum coccineum]